MNTLIKLGIAADRLTAKGWGESKPLSNNASPEDMANNRRVEFVKTS
jgi:OOP family OmpA-OmpF porin